MKRQIFRIARRTLANSSACAALLLLLTPTQLRAQKAMGWFSAQDGRARTLYVTEITTVDLENRWEGPNFAAGFIKSRGWEARSKSEPALRGSVVWITGMEPWRAGELERREYMIAQNRANGWTVVTIPFPSPVKIEQHPAKTSAQ